MSIKSVSLIGSGKVATALALSMFQKGITIHQVWSRDLSNAQKLAQSCDAEALDSIEKLDANMSDAYIISVIDDAIPMIAENFKTEKMVFHTSGKASMDSLQKIGNNIGVFYPFQTFSTNRIIDFEQVPMMLETKNIEHKSSIETFAKLFSKNVLWVDSRERLL